MPVCAPSGWNTFTPGAATIVLSEAVLLPVVPAGSPPPLTVAKFVTEGTAVEATETVSVIALAEVPAAIEAELVHVTVGAAKAQLQPAPLAETKPSPGGRLSVTVIVPLVASEPGAFETVMVYAPLVPTVKLPACVFAITRSGARIEVLAEALLFPATGSVTPPGAATVAVLVVAPTPLAVPATVIETVPPAGSVGIVLVTPFPATFIAPHAAPPEAPVQSAVTLVMAPGTLSEKVAPFAASGPALEMVML
jgi:hypothetical protein